MSDQSLLYITLVLVIFVVALFCWDLYQRKKRDRSDQARKVAEERSNQLFNDLKIGEQRLILEEKESHRWHEEADRLREPLEKYRAYLQGLQEHLNVHDPIKEFRRLQEMVIYLRRQRDSLNNELALAKQSQNFEQSQAEIRAVEQVNELNDLVTQREEEIASLAEKNQQVERENQELEDRFQSLLKQDGRIWQRPYLPSAIPFRPLSERKMPIISILNLKGGVGKTTITANLGGSWAQKGKKVLMIDVDYQRSLSMLCLKDQDRKMLYLEEKCLQHFLQASKHTAAQIIESAIPIRNIAYSNCSIISNSETQAKEKLDSLEEVEMRLMIEWMIRERKSDIRLYLREALHSLPSHHTYDYVLLDCPPRLTTACINALAASDYILIPVLPDTTSTRSVAHLLRTLKQLQPVLPELEVLGILANRVSLRQDKPILQHAEAWQHLEAGARGIWRQSLPFLNTMIPNDNEFGSVASSIQSGECKLAIHDSAIQVVFRDLMNELEQRMSSYANRHLTTIS